MSPNIANNADTLQCWLFEAPDIAAPGQQRGELIGEGGVEDGRGLAHNTISPHPEEPRSGVSKDAPDVSGASWTILRDALLRSAPQGEVVA